jgi:hypothetical protein
MALRFEELEEFFADFGGFHGVRGAGLPVRWLLPAASCDAPTCLLLKRLIIRDLRGCAAARPVRWPFGQV